MSDDTTHSRQKIRTFANDLENARQRRSDAPTPEEKTTPHTPATKHRRTETEPEPEIHARPKTIPEAHPKRTHIEPTAPPKPTEKASRPIPAFHELQKQVDSIQDTKEIVPENTATKSTPDPKRPKRIKQVARPNIGYDSTVIRDTKSNRFKLIPSIITSVKDWFTELRKSSRRRKTPTYSVSETHRRKGVIQKATSKTGALFTADSELIKERIKQRKEQATFSTPSDTPETSWSPYTDTGYPLLHAGAKAAVDTTANVTVELKRPFIPTPEPLPPTPPPAPVAVPQEDPTPDSSSDTESVDQASPDIQAERWAASQDFDVTDETPSEPPDITPPPEEPVDTSEPMEFIPESDPADSEPYPEEFTSGSDRWIDRFDTNTLTIGILLLIVSLLFIIFSVRVLFLNINATDTRSAEEIVAAEAIPILSDATVSALVISSDELTRVPEILRTSPETVPAGLVELAIVSPLGDEISPAEVFGLLDFRTLPSLQQSITTLRLVTVNRGEPSILIRFTDDETVRGGLLAWEANLATDLSVIFDLPEGETGRFVDDAIEGIDVRILQRDGEMLLVYGFVGQNSLLIAPSVTTFAHITDLSRTR